MTTADGSHVLFLLFLLSKKRTLWSCNCRWIETGTTQNFAQFATKDLATGERVNIEWDSIRHKTKEKKEIVKVIFDSVLKLRFVLIQSHGTVDPLYNEGKGEESVENHLSN